MFSLLACPPFHSVLSVTVSGELALDVNDEFSMNGWVDVVAHRDSICIYCI